MLDPLRFCRLPSLGFGSLVQRGGSLLRSGSSLSRGCPSTDPCSICPTMNVIVGTVSAGSSFDCTDCVAKLSNTTLALPQVAITSITSATVVDPNCAGANPTVGNLCAWSLSLAGCRGFSAFGTPYYLVQCYLESSDNRFRVRFCYDTAVPNIGIINAGIRYIGPSTLNDTTFVCGTSYTFTIEPCAVNGYGCTYPSTIMIQGVP